MRSILLGTCRVISCINNELDKIVNKFILFHKSNYIRKFEENKLNFTYSKKLGLFARASLCMTRMTRIFW